MSWSAGLRQHETWIWCDGCDGCYGGWRRVCVEMVGGSVAGLASSEEASGFLSYHPPFGSLSLSAQIAEKTPTKVKNFGIWFRYESRTGTHNAYKEYRELRLTDAISAMYQDMAGRSRAKSVAIQILKTAELQPKDCKRATVSQFHSSTIKFPLPHRIAKSPKAFKTTFKASRPTVRPRPPSPPLGGSGPDRPCSFLPTRTHATHPPAPPHPLRCTDLLLSLASLYSCCDFYWLLRGAQAAACPPRWVSISTTCEATIDGSQSWCARR